MPDEKGLLQPDDLDRIRDEVIPPMREGDPVEALEGLGIDAYKFPEWAGDQAMEILESNPPRTATDIMVLMTLGMAYGIAMGRQIEREQGSVDA